MKPNELRTQNGRWIRKPLCTLNDLSEIIVQIGWVNNVNCVSRFSGGREENDPFSGRQICHTREHTTTRNEHCALQIIAISNFNRPLESTQKWILFVTPGREIHGFDPWHCRQAFCNTQTHAQWSKGGGGNVCGQVHGVSHKLPYIISFVDATALFRTRFAGPKRVYMGFYYPESNKFGDRSQFRTWNDFIEFFPPG